MTNEILRSFTADYTSQIEHAQRADGQWFTRMQYRDARYGYKWAAWRQTSSRPETASTTGRNARLPKD